MKENFNNGSYNLLQELFLIYVIQFIKLHFLFSNM